MNAGVEQRAGFIAAEALVGRPRLIQCLWLLLMFGVAPLIAALYVPPAGWIPALWLVAAIGWRWTPGIYGAVGGRHESYGVTFGEIRRVARRFAVFALLLFLAVVIARPEHFLDWPRHRPFTWLAVMMAYPLASVVPQEMLYRGVIFGRIQAFGGSDRTAVWISAVSFSALHAIYGNVCAVVLTLIGGWFFADTYRRTRSLPLVCVEHALYGNLIFTIGLGDCFSNLPAVV